jgi:lipopolysaccharide/colanic/teichoic acid biosynthesis glycosyltransferase
MYVDAHNRLDDPGALKEAEAAGRVFKVKCDPRVTRVGRLLRTSSLDELPQLINVLLGQMSLVGPRALTPNMVAPYPDWSKARHVMRPGITGLWQVSARERNESLEDMIEYDLEYIRRWSVMLDATILARTPGTVISRKGAV